MYKIFKQVAYISAYYKCSLVYDNMLNYVTIQIINCSGIIDTYRADTTNKWQLEQLSSALKWYSRPAAGASSNRILLNHELKTISKTL